MMDDLELDHQPHPPVGEGLCYGDCSAASTLCPCNNCGSAGEGCGNSNFHGAILSATGSASASTDSLILQISQGTSNQPALFFQGLNFINNGAGVAFGDGLRCCGVVTRLQVSFMDSAGLGRSDVFVAAAGGCVAGDSRCYQAWYRDPISIGGSPCGTFFNLTGALRINWEA